LIFLQRKPGVKLKSVKPGSPHEKNQSLIAGLRLVAVKEGVNNTKSVNAMAYGEVVATLKASSRPLTLFFEV